MERVRKEGRRVRTEHLDVRATSSPLSYPRVGIVVPRFRHTVVERNRLRRRLRELVRRHVLPAIPPQDVLIRAVPTAYGRSYSILESNVQRMVRELKPRLQT